MKKIMVMILGVVLLSVTCFGASETFYQAVYFRTNVYLHDSTNTPLHQRIPTGAVATVDGGIFSPSGPVEFDGAMTIAGPVLLATNGMMITYKPDVSGLGTGVTINANGSITLSKFVAGYGWTNMTIDPQVKLPDAVLGFDRTTIAIGSNASASYLGIALGFGAVGNNGVALGYLSNAKYGNSSIAIGMASLAEDFSVACGVGCLASNEGVSVGYFANSFASDSIAIGYMPNSSRGSIAIGKNSIATNDVCAAIGCEVHCPTSGATAIRGPLYMDGGSNGVYYRTTFASGAWTLGKLMVITNSYTGGVMRLSTDNGNTFKYE